MTTHRVTVFFEAETEFSAPITRSFWRKLRKNIEPFVNLSGVGGTNHGHFKGSIPLEVEALSEEILAYEITSALVSKIELLSKVGVNHVEFLEITIGV